MKPTSWRIIHTIQQSKRHAHNNGYKNKRKMIKMEENKKRYIIATYKIQRSMETLCLYATNEKIKEYLKKIENTAEYYQKEEEKLMEEQRKWKPE